MSSNSEKDYNMSMTYVYGAHCKQRMQERKISVEAIEFLLSEEATTLIVPSKTDPDVELILGFYEAKGYAVIINHKTKKLITVRRLRQNELNNLKKEAKND